MKKKTRIYDGSTKILYNGPQANTNILFFKDEVGQITAANHEIIDGKGVLCNRISEHLFLSLQRIGIPTHFIKRLNMREQLVHTANVIPLKFAIRNSAMGSICTRLGLKLAAPLPQTIIEFFYKNEKQYSIVSEEHVTAFNWASPNEIEDIIQYCIRINDFLLGYFSCLDIDLLDFKLEFGRIGDDNSVNLIIIDELTPKNMRLYDRTTKKYLGQHIKNGALPAIDDYQIIAKKMGLLKKNYISKNFVPYIVE